MNPQLDALISDLTAEHADLRRVVGLADLDAPVASEPWDVRDVVSHLLVGNAKATLAAVDADAFAAELTRIPDPQAFLDGWLAAGQGLDREELTSRWDAGLTALTAALAALEPGAKVPWYGPPMSAMSSATARLMEYWAHGQDVVDGTGLTREPTARLRHVAHLGVRTRGFAYAARGREVPPGEVRVTLTAPDGSTWEWGSGDDAVEGSALGFCLRVTQRRHRDDTDLVATGPLADEWLDLAQCFAGPPTAGRPKT
ncbi:MAG: TIGR03084 family metal-binding protein [Mycobacteriales bacterium]